MVATAFHGKLAYQRLRGAQLIRRARQALKKLGDNPAMMLRNHGLLTTGRTVPEASCGSIDWSAPARSRSTRRRRDPQYHGRHLPASRRPT